MPLSVLKQGDGAKCIYEWFQILIRLAVGTYWSTNPVMLHLSFQSTHGRIQNCNIEYTLYSPIGQLRIHRIYIEPTEIS